VETERYTGTVLLVTFSVCSAVFESNMEYCLYYIQSYIQKIFDR